MSKKKFRELKMPDEQLLIKVYIKFCVINKKLNLT